MSEYVVRFDGHPHVQEIVWQKNAGRTSALLTVPIIIERDGVPIFQGRTVTDEWLPTGPSLLSYFTPHPERP